MLIMTVHAAPIGPVQAGREAVDLGAQGREMFGIGRAGHQHRYGRAGRVALRENRRNGIEEWRGGVGLQRWRRIKKVDLDLVAEDRHELGAEQLGRPAGQNASVERGLGLGRDHVHLGAGLEHRGRTVLRSTARSPRLKDSRERELADQCIGIGRGEDGAELCANLGRLGLGDAFDVGAYRFGEVDRQTLRLQCALNASAPA